MAQVHGLRFEVECQCGRVIYFNCGSRSQAGIDREWERLQGVDCIAADCDGSPTKREGGDDGN